MTAAITLTRNPVADDSPSEGPVCPLCKTMSTGLGNAELAGGGAWRCLTCGQHWDAYRLETVAAYVLWAKDHRWLGRGWVRDIHAPTRTAP